MGKTPTNNGKAWSGQQKSELRNLANHNTPTRVIGLKMGRSESSIQSKASELGVSLKPTNQSPYGTKKKQQTSCLSRIWQHLLKTKEGPCGPSFAFVDFEY